MSKKVGFLINVFHFNVLSNSQDETFQKSVSFCVKLPSLCNSQQVASIVSECIAFVDLLAERAHWRSNISQKLKSIREEANKKLKKRQNEEKLANALKRKSEKDRQKKERIRNLSSQEQRKVNIIIFVFFLY